MRLLFELSGEHETIPRSEVLASIEAEGRGYEILNDEDRILVLDTDASPERLGKRIALAHNICEYISSGTELELEDIVRSLDLDGTIAVRKKDLRPKPERKGGDELMERIGGILAKDHDVDLESPDNEIRLIQGRENYLGLKRITIDRSSFQERKVDNRPFFSPVSLHPKFARALVNLARAAQNVTFLDPFCGTGGILIEAGLVGAELVGGDIMKMMIEGCKKNLKRYNVSATLLHCDVGDIQEHLNEAGSIATDPPYGRSSTTMREAPSQLYERSFRTFGDVLSENGFLAIVLPSEGFIEIGQEYLHLEEVHKQKVHGSLDRFYCVFKNH